MLYLIVVAEVAEFHVFLHVIMIEVFFHPADVAPIQVPVTFPVNINYHTHTSLIEIKN